MTPAVQCPPPAAPKSLRCTMPQVLACLASGTFFFSEGLSLSYSSSLIPALQDPHSDIHITLEQGVLLASILMACIGFGSPVAGLVMNRVGRINTLYLSALPYSVGWFIVASATTYDAILVGRILTGLAISLATAASVVFTTEVAAPEVRAALNSAATTTFASLGVMVCYVLGAFTDWRTTAWICGGAPVITVVLVGCLAYESPIWLVSKGRLEDAAKALQAYARCNDSKDSREELPKRQLEWLIQKRSLGEAVNHIKKPWYRSIVDLFTKPVGYKPFILMTAMFFTQTFGGVYITLFYAAPFFLDMGVKVDEFVAAIIFGATRFLVGVLVAGLIRKVGIRVLMVGSSLGMAVCMGLSGYFTLYPEQGLDGWVAVIMMMLYVAISCCGMLTVPWIITAEMFPDQLREVGQGVTLLVAYLVTFLGLQLYPTLKSAFQYGDISGAVGLQWFFAVVSLANVALTAVFLPETRGKSLHEIEEHFRTNTMWLGRKKDPAFTAQLVIPALSKDLDLEKGDKLPVMATS